MEGGGDTAATVGRVALDNRGPRANHDLRRMSSSVQLGKLLLAAGVVLVVLGLVVILGARLQVFRLGRLPGDVAYRGKHVSVYFPIVSCVILSIVLTLIFWLFSLFGRR